MSLCRSNGKEKMLVFGGFDGTMLNDIMEYESGRQRKKVL